MKTNVVLSYWYNTNNVNEDGYELIGYYTENIYFKGSREECIRYAEKSNMRIVEE